MNTILLFIIALPVIEIFIMIKVGQNIGALNTIMLIFLTAVIGLYFARIQGLTTLKAGLTNIYKNQTPINELFSGASIAVAAMLLIIPGFFTDFIGFLLLIPFTRNLIISPLVKKNEFKKRKEDILEAEVIDEKKDEL
tara:strand:- start:260 stop:673 length:414 start_codon:yes stop_codon:yes gene_type:complete